MGVSLPSRRLIVGQKVFERVLRRRAAISQLKKPMLQVEAGIEADIEPFVAARRALLALFAAKQRLYRATESRFPPSHPLFKTLFGLCHNDATCQIRHLCDVAICKCADRYGDDMFRDRVVDGVRIPAVPHWFYGISDLISREKIALDRTGQLLELLEQTYDLGQKFIDSATMLPFLPPQDLAREKKRFQKVYEKARAQLARTCAAYARPISCNIVVQNQT